MSLETRQMQMTFQESNIGKQEKQDKQDKQDSAATDASVAAEKSKSESHSKTSNQTDNKEKASGGGRYQGKESKPNAKQGREYVDYTKQFVSHTINQLIKCPEKWNELYVLPIAKYIYQIEDLVVQANSVFIPSEKSKKKQSSQEISFIKKKQIKALQRRDDLLEEALQLYVVFDNRFEHLMEHIDILKSDKQRAKKIFTQIAKEVTKKYNEEIAKNNTQNANTNVIPVAIHVSMNETLLQYESISGKKRQKIGITIKNKDTILKLRNQSHQYIVSRLNKDKERIKELLQ